MIEIVKTEDDPVEMVRKLSVATIDNCNEIKKITEDKFETVVDKGRDSISMFSITTNYFVKNSINL